MLIHEIQVFTYHHSLIFQQQTHIFIIIYAHVDYICTYLSTLSATSPKQRLFVKVQDEQSPEFQRPLLPKIYKKNTIFRVNIGSSWGFHWHQLESNGLIGNNEKIKTSGNQTVEMYVNSYVTPRRYYFDRFNFVASSLGR